jgi:hypothetical protein
LPIAPENQCECEPHVCPGCYAIGEEPCAPGCIDAEIAADQKRDGRCTEDGGEFTP